MEYEILINRYGEVLTYRRRRDGLLVFWSYNLPNTIESALSHCRDLPVRIVAQHTSNRPAPTGASYEGTGIHHVRI